MGEALKTRRGKSIDPLTFYNNGNENVAVTGGWVTGFSENAGTQSKKSDHLFQRTTYTQGLNNTRTWVAGSKINFADITTLYFELDIDATVIQSTSYVRVAVVTNSNGVGSVADTALTQLNLILPGKNIYTVDVSGVSGEYYISILQELKSTENSSSFIDTKIYKVWGVV